MTDYRTITEKSKSSDRKDEFAKRQTAPAFDETKQGLISKDQESDGLVSKSRDLINKYRPDITIKDPSTFAFFGSAKKYYQDAFDKIVGFYPYDGTRKEILEWYENATVIEVGLLQNHWPSYVGHVNISSNALIDFYSGPQSIPEFEYSGNYIKGETGLVLDPSVGNTVEFWFKKEGFSAEKETIFDIGTYPGKIDSSKMGKFKLFLSNSAGSPFYVDYLSGSTGVSSQRIGSPEVTRSSVADGKWHHYAIKVYQSGPDINLDFFVDGNFNKTTVVPETAFGKVDTYMGGCIGGDQNSSEGSLSGSLDEFRFWKGKRSIREIGRFYDQTVFASETETLETAYTSRLGLYYKFNKPSTNNEAKDAVVLDYSGNDIVGIIKNFSSAIKVQQSAITLSENTATKENPDPVLDSADFRVKEKLQEFLIIGESYDDSNSSNLRNFVPEWIFDSNNNGTSNPDSQISILFHLMATEFDEIRMNLDSILKERTSRYESLTPDVLDYVPIYDRESSSSYDSNNFFVGCEDSEKVFAHTNGSHADFAIRKCEQVGIKVKEKPLANVDTSETQDLKVQHVTVTKPFEEIRRSILENIYSSAKFMLRKKGTQKSFEAPLSSYGIDTDLISYNIYGQNTDIFIDNTKLNFVTEEKNSVFLGENLDSTIFLSSSNTEERTYLEADTVETEYTFEGTFIFPSKTDFEHKISISSIFGLAQVSDSNNDLTITGTNNADFVIKVVKQGRNSDDAKFVLTSNSGIISDIETQVFKEVYKNSKWNIAIRVVKSLDNKFLNSSAASYKVEFLGHNHTLDVLQNSFSVAAPLTTSQYQNFRNAHKTIFIGAQRTNITGSVLIQSDIKVIDFNAWNDELSDQELAMRSRSPSTTGRRLPHLYRDNYSTTNTLMDENKILSIQFDASPNLTDSNDLLIVDATSGSADQVIKFGPLIGSKYPAKSTVFSNNLKNVIQREFLPTIRNIPLGNLHGEQGIEIKNSEINKFDLSSRPEGKIFSFEKSMYNAISKEMVDFIGGLVSFNSIIGEPVNKYRKSYKMLDHLRQKFFETVESESQFERFVSYFRWIDKSVGHFLEQIVPATAISNTGIEDVIESHALERNKYDHKAPLVERKEYDSGLEANLLAINELLYDWQHGHFSSGDNDNCLWQKDRKERTEDREQLRKVLTTVVSGSTYVRRNLVKPYRHTIDRQTLLNLGSNRNANKNKDLYKVINEGKEIVIASDDIYEFKQCNDVLNPGQDKIYTAKTNTTHTDDYLDADSDMILPFSLYSSSVGTDFENFKQNLKITNNHDDIPALQSPHVKGLVGGLPHRNVKFGTADKDRPEAYDISSSANSLVIKQTSAPKSMFHQDLGGARFYHIANVKTTENPLVIGNYSKEYEIVMTNGRSLNNNYLVENEGLNLTGSFELSSNISEAVDFFVPERPARDHVIVNRFSAPGGPESAAAANKDRESSEYSVYNTVNYRNPLVRRFENLFSAEHSEQFGYRSGSSVQASRHMTNRNRRYFTGSLGGEFASDNNFIQHEIPQIDFGYSWITASADETVYDFLNKNENIGHQHIFTIPGSLKSSQTISFLTSSISAESKLIDFVGLNTNIRRSLNTSTNTLDEEIQKTISFDSETTGEVPTGWRENQHDENQVPGQYVRENSEDPKQKILAFSGFWDAHTNGAGLNLPTTTSDYFRWAEYTAQGFDTPLRISFEYILGNEEPGLSQNFGLTNQPEQQDKLYLQYKVGTGGAYKTLLTIGEPGESNTTLQTRFDPMLDTFHNASAFLGQQADKVYFRWVAGTFNSLTRDHYGIRNIVVYKASELRDLLNNRQGPYSWPTWKQIRGEQHPIARAHKKNNKLSVVHRTHQDKKYAFIDSIKGNYKFDYKDTEDVRKLHLAPRVVENYDEMFVTSKFNPLNINLARANFATLSLESLDRTFRALFGFPMLAVNQIANFHMWTNDEYYLSSVARDAQNIPDDVMGLSYDSEDEFTLFSPRGTLGEEAQSAIYDMLIATEAVTAVSMRASVANKITGFSQREFEDLIISGVENPELWTKYIDSEKFTSDQSFDVLKLSLLSGIGSGLMRELNYIETIYPREINTYTKKSRVRENFDFFGWNSNRSNRNLILSGNISYSPAITEFTTNADFKLFFIPTANTLEGEFKKSFFDTFDIIDVNSTGSDASIAQSTHITSSKWVLDSRQNFTSLPLNITSSYFNEGDAFVRSRSQGTRGEGILQNDYSIFGLGYNGLRGAPPFSPLYNRRIPQEYGNDVYLAGEAKWEAAKDRTGPFYDKYLDYSQGLKEVGQTYSLIPEFRIHNVLEDFYNSKRDPKRLAPDNFLQLTGAVYHSSSGDLSVGSQFFKTYSMSDFMKYFQVVKDDVEDNNLGLAPGKITLRCQAVKRFLPYRGFYPAERVVQISEIFNRGYLRRDFHDTLYMTNTEISEEKSNQYLDFRINNAKAQAIKPLMAPGVLLNSIKAGLAVDYPLFSQGSGLELGLRYISSSVITSSLDDFSVLSLDHNLFFTGSDINSSQDEGIPRISGSVDYRVTFDDLLNIEHLYSKTIHDNEPHPSASSLIGAAEHFKVLDRPVSMGQINNGLLRHFTAMKFKNNRITFIDAMRPFSIAVQNFCANTVDFFLEDGRLSTMTSNPGPHYFDNKTYKMKVHLVNRDTMMYDRHSAFGPPVDEGDPEITRFEYLDSTVLGVKASGSVSFSNSLNGSNLTGSTVTITDYKNNSSTYEFISDIEAVKATASIQLHSGPNLNAVDQNVGAKVTIPNHGGGGVTYQFVRDVIAATATGSVDFTGLTNTSVSASTITLPNFDGSNQKTYEFVNDIQGVKATASIDVQASTVMVSTNQTIGTKLTVPNHGGGGVTYQFVRDLVAATATGSVDFSSLTKTSVSSSTITLPDFDGNNQKTYEFVNNQPASAATASILFAGSFITPGKAVRASQHYGAVINITNSAGNEIKTYQFVRDIVGVTASGSISLYTPDSDVAGYFEGDTVTIPDFDGNNTRTYQFVTNSVGIAATASLDFANTSRGFLSLSAGSGGPMTLGITSSAGTDKQFVYLFDNIGATASATVDFGNGRPFADFNANISGDRGRIMRLGKPRDPGDPLANANTFGDLEFIKLEGDSESDMINANLHVAMPSYEFQVSGAYSPHPSDTSNMSNDLNNSSRQVFFAPQDFDHGAIFQVKFGDPSKYISQVSNALKGAFSNPLPEISLSSSYGGPCGVGTSNGCKFVKYYFYVSRSAPGILLNYNAPQNPPGDEVYINVFNNDVSPNRFKTPEEMASSFSEAVNRRHATQSFHFSPTFHARVGTGSNNQHVVGIISTSRFHRDPAAGFNGLDNYQCFISRSVAGQGSKAFGHYEETIPNTSNSNRIAYITTGSQFALPEAAPAFTYDQNTTEYFLPIRQKLKAFEWVDPRFFSINTPLNRLKYRLPREETWNQWITKVNNNTVESSSYSATSGIGSNFGANRNDLWNQKSYKFVDTTYTHNGATMANLFANRLHKFQNLTGTLTSSIDAISVLDPTFGTPTKDIRLVRTDMSSSANHTPVGSKLFRTDRTPQAWYSRIMNNIGTGSTTAFTGGSERIIHTNGGLTSDGDVIIAIGTSDTNPSDFASLTSASISSAFSGEITVNRNSDFVMLTQSASDGVGGNTPIFTNFFVDPGEILTGDISNFNSGLSRGFFAGGVNPITYTNGQTHSQINPRRAVEVSTVSNISDAINQLSGAISIAQPGEFTLDKSITNHLIISMATENQEVDQQRTITGTGKLAVSNRLSGFKNGVNPLTFGSDGTHISSAVGYENYPGIGDNIAVRVGTKQTYEDNPSNLGSSAMSARMNNVFANSPVSGISAFKFNNTFMLTASSPGASGNKAITFAQVSQSTIPASAILGFGGGFNAVTYTNGQPIGGGNTNIAVEVSSSNSMLALTNKFKSAIQSAQSGEFTFGYSGTKLIIFMATANTATAAPRTIQEGGNAFNGKVLGFSDGVTGLDFTSGDRLDAATGWSDYFGSETNSNIAIRVGTKPTYANSAVENAGTTIAMILKQTIEAKQTLTASLNSSTVLLTQSATGTLGNQTITSVNVSSSNFAGQGHVLGFSGGIDNEEYTTGQAVGGGNTNIAVEVSSDNSVSDLRNSFKSAIQSAQSGEFTFANSSNKLVISMATTNTELDSSRTIQEGGSAFNNKVLGFSAGVTGLDFTDGNRLDAATGWSDYFGSDTNSNIAIVVGTKSTYANNATNQTSPNVANEFSQQIIAKQGLTSSVNINRILLTQSATGTAGNQAITSVNVSSSNFVLPGYILGFSGGIDGADYTTGQAIGGGNTNIAVVVGTENSGSIEDNDVFLTAQETRDEFGQAVTAAQATNLEITSTTDGSNFVTLLKQKGTGSVGNKTITKSGGPAILLGMTGGVNFVQGVIESTPVTTIESSSHGYLPYVPPFLDPNTSPYAELSFTPEREGEYTIPQILENLQITYYNMPAPSNASDNINYKEAMVLSASIDFRTRIKLFEDFVSFNPAAPEGPEMFSTAHKNSTIDLSRWVIKPKWETPILDFSDVTSSALNLSNNTEQQVSGSPWKNRYQDNYYQILNSSSVPYLTASTGMWHQSGTLISELAEKGYYMVIESGDLDNVDSYTSSDLASKVGFLAEGESRTQVRLGKVAPEKVVWEGVVAIPFYNDHEDGLKFFNIDPLLYESAVKYNKKYLQRYTRQMTMATLSDSEKKLTKMMYDNFYNTPGTNAVHNIAYQLRMMEKFSMPPQFDFVNDTVECANVEPFVQYIFQFHGKFTQEDLSSIWQNLYPNSREGIGSAKHSSPFAASATDYPDVEYISNFLDVQKTAIFQSMKSNYQNPTEFLENEVRWMVFKVKQRGTKLYGLTLRKSLTKDNLPNLFSIDGMNNQQEIISNQKSHICYNWPYDYFSIVELGKLESKVDFYDDILSSPIPKESPRSSGPPKPFGGADTSQRRQTQSDGDDASRYTLITDISRPTEVSALSSTVADSMVFREVLLSDTDTPTTRVFNASSGNISSGTEQVYVNGVLQSLGAGNDYIISGNTITFTYDLEAGDNVVVSYVKD